MPIEIERDEPLGEYIEDTIEEPFDMENPYDMDTDAYFDGLFDDLNVDSDDEDVYG